jgi:hypothetical protein
MNKALSIGADYSVFCDDDVLFTKNWLNYGISFLESNNDAGIAVYIESKNKNIVDPNISKPVNTFYGISHCMIVKNTKLRMDERYLKYRFDVDFCLRMWEQESKRVVLMPVIVYHTLGRQYYRVVEKEKREQNRVRDKELFSLIWDSTGRKKELFLRIKNTYPELLNEPLRLR